MQDRYRRLDGILLRRTAGPYIGSDADLRRTARYLRRTARLCPLWAREQAFRALHATHCRLLTNRCAKCPALHGNPVKKADRCRRGR